MKGPAISQIVISGFWMLILIFLIVDEVRILNSGVEFDQECMETWTDLVDEDFARETCQTGPDAIIMLSIITLGNIALLVCANIALARESTTAMYISSILSIIPCISACVWLGLPFGIWGLVAANQNDKKKRSESYPDAPSSAPPTPPTIY
ncbi:MAG: hypothetical protein KDK34_18310 [Leptospiraceae bacterium]|nr:hypothetical protein [Leptospiraceae bacterium]